MGLLAKLVEPRMDVLEPSSIAEPSRSLLEALGATPSPSGVPVSVRRAEGLPAVYGCVDVISTIVGWLPLKLMRSVDAGGREPDLDNPLYDLLHSQPNPVMSAYDFRTVVDRWKLLWGTGYAEIEYTRGGRPRALWPLRTDRMEPMRFDTLNRPYWQYRLESGSLQTFRWHPERPPLLRVMINSLDGYTGRSPVRVLMDSLGVSLAARDYGAYLFANRANPGGILKFKTPPKDEPTRERNKASWNKAHSGVGNAGRTAVLEGDVEYESIGLPPQEAQFIELMKFQLEEVAGRIYRVPPFLVGHTEKSTSWGTGLEQQLRAFLTVTMMGHLTGWTQAIRRDLIVGAENRGRVATFVTNAFVQAVLETRMKAYKSQIEIGMLSPNEARAAEDLGPRRLPNGDLDPAGDAYWRPANMTSTAEDAPDPQAPAKPADDDEDDD